MRPVVSLKNYFSLVTEKLLCLHNVLSPRIAVTNLCASECVEVVHCAGTVFSHPQSLVFWKVGVHLGRRFCVGSKLEHHFNTVNLDGFGSFLHLIRR